jgi:replicative DNA helicase
LAEEAGVVVRVPTAIPAERAVLGSLLRDGGDYALVSSILSSEDFFDAKHRAIWGAVVALAEKHSTIDLVTVSAQLVQMDALEAAGGIGYVSSLADELHDQGNITTYAEIVRDYAVRRGAQKFARALTEQCSTKTGETKQIVSDALRSLDALSMRLYSSSSSDSASSLDESIRRMENIQKHGASLLQTGFVDLDFLLISMEPQDVIIVAARPSVGKTAWACNNVAINVCKTGRKVALFSMEMSANSLQSRNLAREAKIPFGRFRTGTLTKEDWESLGAARDVLANLCYTIDDTSGLTPLDILAKCRRIQASTGLDLVVVDYIQLMSSGRRRDNPVQEVTAISAGLKGVAKQLNVPVMVLSQLSRANESQKREPILSDLRESGAIEQDADVVIFLHRDSTGVGTETIKFHIAKHRNGPCGTRKLLYFPEFLRFENYLLAEGP